MVAHMILRRLSALGVVLSIAPDGRLAFDAPTGAVGLNELDAMRLWKDELLALLSDRSDEHKDAISLELVLCPWCQRGDRLANTDRGFHCERCNRLAWRIVEVHAIERVDSVDWVALDVPIFVQDSPETLAPQKTKRLVKANHPRLKLGA